MTKQDLDRIESQVQRQTQSASPKNKEKKHIVAAANHDRKERVCVADG